MVPRYLQETVLNLCIIIGAIVGGVGIVCLCLKGFSKTDALLVTALGAAVFFGFLKVKSIVGDHEGTRKKKDSEDSD